MASASGSQTEGADDDGTADSESEASDTEGASAPSSSRSRWTILSGRTLSHTLDTKSASPNLGPDSGSASSGPKGQARVSPRTASFGAELGGRGEYVLVERRGAGGNAHNTAGALGERGSSSALGRWSSSLLEARDSGSHGRKRPGSPAVSASRSSAGQAGASGHSGGSRTRAGRSAQRTPEPSPREPSPPLTIDSIHSTYNPFPLFHIRVQEIPEVALLTGGLLFALIRLHGLRPTEVLTSIPPLPFYSMLSLTLAIPFIALFRRQASYYKVPFTDERGYRDPRAADDGITSALTLPVLLACAVYWDTYTSSSVGRPLGLEGVAPLVQVWESSGVYARVKTSALSLSPVDPTLFTEPAQVARALFKARHELVLMTALNGFILVLHLALAHSLLRIDRLPKSNAKRFFGFMTVAYVISGLIYVAFTTWDWISRDGLSISPLEAATTTLIQQASFYIVSRLARRGFTLGELNTMTIAGNALCLEFWRLTRARWNYKRGFPGIPPTFRSPTPVLIFQSVLIPGAFLSGFLLSPLLVISRHIASKPAHRLKWPTERERHRRLLAAGVFLGLSGIVFIMLGGWAGWMLGSEGRIFRRPWIWAIQFMYLGGDGVNRKDKPPTRGHWQHWRRLALLAYWTGTIIVAVGGWQTHLVRARRIRMRNAAKSDLTGPPTTPSSLTASISSSTGAASTGSGSNSEKRMLSSGATNGTQGTAIVQGPTELRAGSKVGIEMAREEKRVHASLNMRRKFFHALAVVMFVPGIAVDPAFTSLAFSVAFALFTFSEYARYFALYPIGAPLHIFFSEFVDSKDSGPVILSHFYLLTGCAGGLWLEGHGINRYTGVLVLGIGDAMASIVGRLVGRVRWLGTNKTVEGTIAFVVSVTTCAWLLRLTGVTESFSMPRYLLATILSALLEASSNQNDNLIIPIYMWSLVTLLDA